MSNLRIPGPTPLPNEVLTSIGKQMINHRGASYEEMQARVVNNLQHFFQTAYPIYLLTSSGMGGLEAAIVNFFSPQDRILAFTVGEFGNRWAEIALRYGANLLNVKFPVGTAVDKDEVYRMLAKEEKVAGVLITHNETATGVLNPIADIVPIIKAHKSKPLVLIDSISALGAVDLPMDALGIDVLITASQKAWMAPPGLSMIAVSPHAWDKHLTAKMPRYYWDLSMYKEFAEKNQTPATPAVSVLFGLDTSLAMMKKEGREKIFARHITLRDYVRSELLKMKLHLFVSDAYASPTVTSVIVPDGIDGHELLKNLREKHDVVLAGGMGETKGKIIRIAHMGWVGKSDIDSVLAALKQTLTR